MASYYIATTGNDSTGNGTSGNPWATLSKAVTSSTTGDTINVAAGTYAFANASNRTVTGPTPTYTSPLPSVIFNSSVTQTLSGTTNINYCGFTGVTQSTDNTCIFICPASGFLTFTGCSFYSNLFNAAQGGGLFCGRNTSGMLTTIGCTFYSNTSSASNNSGYFSGGDLSLYNVTCTNCTFYNNAGAGLFDPHMFGRYNDQSTTAPHVFKNNIMYSANGVALNGINQPKTAWFSGSNTNCAYGYTSVQAGLNATVTSDPLFVDVANNNFSLRPTSPCLDVGTL